MNAVTTDMFLHLSEEARAIVEEPNHVRVAFIRHERFIVHNAVSEVLNEAAWMIGSESHRAPGLIVSARPGSGKTQLARRLQKIYPPRENEATGITVTPVILISMSGAHDAKAVYGRILDELKVPVSTSTSANAREGLVMDVLNRGRCRILVLDESQDILHGTRREQQRVLEGLKLIMNSLNLPIIAFGTETAGKAFLSDEHLAARFRETKLPVWKKGDELAGLLKTVGAFLPLRKPSSLLSSEVVNKLLKHSGGVLSPMMRLIQDAAIHAIHEGHEHVDASMIQRAVGGRPPASILLPTSTDEGDQPCV